ADAQHTQTLRIALPNSVVQQPERVFRTEADILDKLRAIPGVTSAGYADAVAMEGVQHQWDSVQASGHSYETGEILPLRWAKFGSPGFVGAMGTKLAAGRDMTWSEVSAARPVVMISESLAREFWGSARAAVGQQIRTFSLAPWFEVVGVVQDVRETAANQKAP